MKLSNSQIWVIMVGSILISFNALIPPWRQIGSGDDLGHQSVGSSNQIWKDRNTGHPQKVSGEIDTGSLLAATIAIAGLSTAGVCIFGLFPLPGKEDDTTTKSE